MINMVINERNGIINERRARNGSSVMGEEFFDMSIHNLQFYLIIKFLGYF